MKTSEVLRKAARFLERQMLKTALRNGGCFAIVVAIPGGGISRLTDNAVDRLRFIVGDTHYIGAYWFGRPEYDDCQNHRIVALCLAAAIAESEGD